ncbi:DEAD/DEAH box helicase [Methylocella tundrae]|uniref:Superfamily II DNA or RNA helicase, SNF2 family n=1 Tax=Methylocella tundrae TaxID=227605 RepID=A0A4U8Z5F9_METTU
MLARNTYLVIDPDLKIALDVVRRKQAASKDERREFMKNPRAAIAEALGAAEEEAAASLFVETAQYSDRVLELGLWEPPALAWLTRKSGQWLPESFPIWVGSRQIAMTPDSITTLKQNCAAARQAGEADIEVQGERHSVDVVEQAVREAEALYGTFNPDRAQPPADAADNANQAGDPSAAPEDPASGDDLVLLIKTNIDGLDYELVHPRRGARIARDLPHQALGATTPQPHQLEGFDWLVKTWSAGWPGVLLADDMGLGKTLQALLFLAWIRRNELASGRAEPPTKRPILIVAPTALLTNWVAESVRHLAQHALGTCVEAFGSSLVKLKRPKGAQWSPEDALEIGALTSADWILTTYETLADNHRAFARVFFSVIVFDEMQKVKSPGTINTQSAKAMHADFVIGLTGTPIENRIEDLWCVMDRIAPGYLGDLKNFSAEYGGEDPAALKMLKVRLEAPFREGPAVMLRRMKEEILVGLPKKNVKKYPTPMPSIQSEAYDAAVAEARKGKGDPAGMLKVVHALRSISLHPTGAQNVDSYDAHSVRRWIAASARLSKTIELLHSIRSASEKAIVFIEDLEIQKTLAAAVPQLLGLSKPPDVINGGTPGKKRQAVVDRFQDGGKGFDLLLLSPRAAGVGLTITAANHVIHLSRWWNPAVEDQCNDRVYRIGQDREVTIHVPIARHPVFGDESFDHTLDDLLEIKRKLSRHMLAPPVQSNDVSRLFGAAIRGEQVQRPPN